MNAEPNKNEFDAMSIARQAANDLAGESNVDGLVEAVEEIAQAGGRPRGLEAVSLGDVVSVAALIVNLAALVVTVRMGRTHQGATKEEVAERLIDQVGKQTKLTKKETAAIVHKIIDKTLDA